MTAKQKLFCEEYLTDFNAKRAAIAAGYSEKTAKQIGSENLTKPDLIEYIEKNKKEMSERLQITRESQLLYLEKYKWQGRIDMREYGTLALRAVEIQNKMLGLNEEKEQGMPIAAQINVLIQDMTIQNGRSKG